MPRYSGTDALYEHLLSGETVSVMEAMLLFGVQSPRFEIFRLKKKGYTVNSRKIPMTKALVRLNKQMVCEPPEALPHKEIFVTEYWVEQ